MDKTPNPDAVLCDEITGDNADRTCECCGATPIQQGFVMNDVIYFCTIECLREHANSDGVSHDMLEWLEKADNEEDMDESDLEYIYWTEWEEG